MNEIENIDYNVKQLESVLENIFNSFTNDDFESLEPVHFVYKNTIRFVPVELKNQVEMLLEWIEMMNESKDKILARRPR